MAMASHNQNRLDLLTIKVNNRPLDVKYYDVLVDLVIDSSLQLPDMIEIVFHLPWDPQESKYDFSPIDGDIFPLGKPIEAGLQDPDNPRSINTIFKGEITSIEPDFADGGLATFIVRGFDKSYRLHRESKTKAWLNTKDSDIASAVASNAGLSAQVEATSEVFKHVYQHAQSDMEFLRERAERIGYEFFVQDQKLYFRKPDPTGSAVDLEWGTNLESFHPRLTVSDQVNEVSVQGWDIKKKEPIIGTANSSKTSPEIGTNGWGGKVAQTAVSAAKKIQVRQHVQSQSDANTVAKAILNEINSGFVEAEGVVRQGSNLKAGMLVNIKNVGTKFGGKYKLTSVRHVYGTHGQFITYFKVEGARPQIISALLKDDEPKSNGWAGVVPAVVTNNKDDENDWGHIKVKYPWLDQSSESFWARLTGPGFGADRGIYFLPEVNDEVLVAFEQGDFNRPYIIGGLFNGKDKAAAPLTDVVKSGKVETRLIRTRAGHVIRLTDKSGEEKIEVIDCKSETTITMDTANKEIKVTSTGDIKFEADGNISFTSKKNVEIKATQNITTEATQNYTLTGKAGVKIESNANTEIKGTMLKAEGTGQAEFSAGGMATVKASGIMTIQGSLVKIN